MTPLQFELTRLIGKKELTFGCKIYLPETERYNRKGKEGYGYIHVMTSDKTMSACLCNGNYIPNFYYEERNTKIIGHPATETDFKRWMNENESIFGFNQDNGSLFVYHNNNDKIYIPYDSSKDLLDQEEETLKQIVDLVYNNQ